MHVNLKQRPRHSPALKAEVLAACAEPGASVAAVALAFKLNDKLVHQWRRGLGAPKSSRMTAIDVAEVSPRFIELTVPTTMPSAPAAPASPPSPNSEMITLEFKRGALGISVTWPVKLNGHDPWAHLKDILTKLPTHLNSRIDELLPHNWRPAN